jgi:hypothetical protein
MPMSFYFKSIPPIPFSLLMDGRLEMYNIRAVMSEGAMGLEGPDGVLYVLGEKGETCSFASYGRAPWAVINAIRAAFPVEFVGEEDHRYYGFATEEAYLAWRSEGPGSSCERQRFVPNSRWRCSDSW